MNKLLIQGGNSVFFFGFCLCFGIGHLRKYLAFYCIFQEIPPFLFLSLFWYRPFAQIASLLLSFPTL